MGAKILDKTLRMNGDKLTKVREESPRVTLKYQKGGGVKSGGPSRGRRQPAFTPRAERMQLK